MMDKAFQLLKPVHDENDDVIGVEELYTELTNVAFQNVVGNISSFLIDLNITLCTF